MATVTLGSIKFNWKGAYNSSTAYAVDDVVSSGGNSYVCIQAHTNQAVGNATAYWNIMSSAGTNGTDGTDVGATLANKEIAFKTNAGAVDGIPIGTAGQFLKVNSGATGYEYGAVSSDFVKLIDHDISSTVSGMSITGWINNSTYQGYLIRMSRIKMNAEDKFKFHWVNDSGTSINTGTDYKHVTDHDYMSGSSASTNIHSSSGTNGIEFTSNNYGTSYHKNVEISVTALDLNSASHTTLMFQTLSRETGGQIDYGDGFGYFDNNTAFTNSNAGFALDRQGSGSFTSGNISVYGLK